MLTGHRWEMWGIFLFQRHLQFCRIKVYQFLCQFHIWEEMAEAFLSLSFLFRDSLHIFLENKSCQVQNKKQFENIFDAHELGKFGKGQKSKFLSRGKGRTKIYVFSGGKYAIGWKSKRQQLHSVTFCLLLFRFYERAGQHIQN